MGFLYFIGGFTMSGAANKDAPQAAAAPAMFVPLQLLGKCVGTRMACLLDDGREIEGTLLAHDSTCTVVLQDATEYTVEWKRSAGGQMTAERHAARKFRQMIVNSRHIETLVPGGVPV